MHLYVIRHGEYVPDHTADPGNPPLSARGHQQAQCLAQSLCSRKVDCIITSGLQRAIQTAQPLAQLLNLPILQEPQLHEMHPGELAAWGSAEEAQWQEITACWHKGNLTVGCPGEESLQDVIDRVHPILMRLLQQQQEQNIVIIAHAVVNCALLPLLCPELRPLSGQDLGYAYTGIWELVGKGTEFVVVRKNDTSHLQSLQDVTD